MHRNLCLQAPPSIDLLHRLGLPPFLKNVSSSLPETPPYFVRAGRQAIRQFKHSGVIDHVTLFIDQALQNCSANIGLPRCIRSYGITIGGYFFASADMDIFFTPVKEIYFFCS